MLLSFGRFPEDGFEVFTPFHHRVALADLNLEELIVSHVGSKTSQRLTATATNPNQEGMAPRLLDDAGDSGHMLDGEPEDRQKIFLLKIAV